MKKKNISLLLVTLLVMLSSCSEFYSDEQYEHYVSFKAPTSTVSRIRLKYRKGQPSPYRLPLIVAGSTMNNKDIDVHVGIDNDTLDIYNYEHYYEREDLYYKQLPENFYSIPNYDIHIPAGECQALMDINFNFNGLDLSEKWVLPLIIKDDPSYNYTSHPRKNFNNALLWITPFNDFSGNYGTTALNVFPEDTNKPLVVDTREAYVVDENTIFFYAGAIKEKRTDRRKFKIYATFNQDPDDKMKGTVELRAENPNIEFKSRKTKCDGREKRKAIFEAKTKCAQKSRLLPPSGQNTSVVQTPFESCLNDAFLLNFLLKYHLKPIANLAKNRIFT